MLFEIDAGELPDEPEELYALADAVSVACGGHAGDEASMARVVRACLAHGTKIGAHPSYVDREGFGRRELEVDPDMLRAQIYAQCMHLRAVTEREDALVTTVKPHGALYHAAHREASIARACVQAAKDALGLVAMIGPRGGALEREARAAGMPYLVEAFADRGVRADGTLVPRGEPGAIVADPALAAARAREILASGAADALCVHGDTPSSVAIARAVRAALDEPSSALRAVGPPSAGRQ